MNINGGVGGGRQDTTQAVASGVFKINTSVSTFHRLVNTLGTRKDTPQLRDKLHKTILHIAQLVKDTSAKLKKLSETDHQRGVDQRKKIVEVAKDFQALLNEFEKAQRLAAERETVYAPLVHKPSLSSSYTVSEADVNEEMDLEQQSLLLESKGQELVLLDNVIAFNEAFIEEREQQIQAMQQTTGEVHEIFKDMAVLVHNEEAMIDVDAEKDLEQQTLLLESKRQELALLDNEIAYNEAFIEKGEQKIQEMQHKIGEVHKIFKDVAVLVQDEEAMIDVDAEKDPEQQALLLESKRQELALLDNEIAYNEAFIEKREQKIQEMQQKIGEVHEIFKDVAVLVQDEEALIDVDAEKDPEQQAILLESKREELALLDNEIAYNEAFIEKREQKIQEMHQKIGTVHEIFKDVAVLVQDEEAMIDVNAEKDPEQQALLLESKRQELALLDNEIAYNEAFIVKREQKIQEMQQEIGDVHEIFNDMAVLVHDEEVMIEKDPDQQTLLLESKR